MLTYDASQQQKKEDVNFELLVTYGAAMGSLQEHNIHDVHGTIRFFSSRCCLACVMKNMEEKIIPIYNKRHALGVFELQAQLRGLPPHQHPAATAAFWATYDDATLELAHTELKAVFRNAVPCVMGEVLCKTHFQQKDGKCVERFGKRMHGLISWISCGCWNKTEGPPRSLAILANLVAALGFHPHEMVRLSELRGPNEPCCEGKQAFVSAQVMGVGRHELTVSHMNALRQKFPRAQAESVASTATCCTPGASTATSCCPGAPLKPVALRARIRQVSGVCAYGG